MCKSALHFFLFCCLIGMAGLPVVAQQPRLDAKGELMNMDELDLSSMAQPVPENNRFIDSAYNIWCGSVIKAENGNIICSTAVGPNLRAMAPGLHTLKLHWQKLTVLKGLTNM
jgi:hypothetical protein